MRGGLGHEGGAFSKGASALNMRPQRDASPFCLPLLPWEDSCLKEEEDLTRHQTPPGLGLVLPAFRTARNTSVSYQPCSLWYLEQAEWTAKMVNRAEGVRTLNEQRFQIWSASGQWDLGQRHLSREQ